MKVFDKRAETWKDLAEIPRARRNQRGRPAVVINLFFSRGLSFQFVLDVNFERSYRDGYVQIEFKVNGVSLIFYQPSIVLI